MKKRIKYTDEPIGKVRIVEDFLPPPEELADAEVNVKVTIALSSASIEFFKRAAKRNKTQYQKLIRRVLDLYAKRYDENAPGTGMISVGGRNASFIRERSRKKYR